MIEAGLSATSVYPSERIIFRNGTGTRLAASFDNQTKTVSVIITSTVSGLPITDATGAVDVITATYSTKLVLADKLLCAFVATGANATATPSFNPDGLGAKTIVKKGGQVLVAGDIPGALAVCILEYNLANTRWELLNPASGATGANGVVPIVTATGTVDVIIADFTPDLTLTDLMMCAIVTSGTNTTAVTFTPDGLTTRAIVYNGVALVAGQMPKVAILEYDLANTRWELLNPIANATVSSYSLQFWSGVALSPADATTYYMGAFPVLAPITTAAVRRIYIPKTGTIKSIYFFNSCGTAGTAETSTFYVRLNNTTDTAIATVAVTGTPFLLSNNGLSIAVTQGDYIEIKWITPTWATNPITMLFSATIYIQT